MQGVGNIDKIKAICRNMYISSVLEPVFVYIFHSRHW